MLNGYTDWYRQTGMIPKDSEQWAEDMTPRRKDFLPAAVSWIYLASIGFFAVATMDAVFQSPRPGPWLQFGILGLSVGSLLDQLHRRAVDDEPIEVVIYETRDLTRNGA